MRINLWLSKIPSMHAKHCSEEPKQTKSRKHAQIVSLCIYIVFHHIFSIFIGCFFVLWLIPILSFEKRKIICCHIYLFFIHCICSYFLDSSSLWYWNAYLWNNMLMKCMIFFKFQNLVALTLASSYMFMFKVENSVCRRKWNLDPSLVKCLYLFPLILFANSLFKLSNCTCTYTLKIFCQIFKFFNFSKFF